MGYKDSNGKIRVALVCTSINQLGGKNNHLKNIYKFLNGGEFKIFIICCSKVEKEVSSFMLRNGVPAEDLILIPRIKKWLVVFIIWELRKFFLAKKIKIVHTFDLQSDIFGSIAAKLSGINKIYSFFESTMISENNHWLKIIFYRSINILIKGFFKKNVVASYGLKNELVSGEFRPAESVVVIHLGIEIPEKFRNLHCYLNGLSEAKPVIGTISRLSKEKAIDRFISAIPFVLHEIPNARFIIVGKGAEEKRLKAACQKQAIDLKVTFKEWTDRVFEELEALDLFVMPSQREGCPTALLEALAAARPVVASEIEGISDIIENGKDGLMVDTKNPRVFAQAIVSLCRNFELAYFLGKNGYQKVKTHFTIENEMNLIKDLYRGS